MKPEGNLRKPTWKEYFYLDELNFGYPIIRKGCTWVILNMPDFSFTTGVSRILVNLGLLFVFIYITAMLLMEGITAFGIVSRILIIAMVTNLAYSKTVAYFSMQFMEKFQKQMKETFK